MTPAALALALVLATTAGAPPKPAEPPAKDPLSIGARIEARETFAPAGAQPDPRAPWTGSLSLETARVGAKYRRDDILLELEAELGRNTRVRDAYLELDAGHGLALRAGQFKSPASAITMDSSWELPGVGRGRVHEILTDVLHVGGRRPGAQVAYRGGGWLAPRVAAGIWQGLDHEGEPRDGRGSELVGETAAARASVRPGPVTLGLSGSWRAAQPFAGGPFDRFWAGAADAVVETEWRLRSWVEAGAGSSWIDDDPTDDRHAVFGFARSVLAWRLGGARKGAPYFEPFASAGALDPDSDVRDDLVYEGAVGMNVGRWKRWRGQLQFQSTRASRNAPDLLFVGAPREGRAVLLQIGVSL